MTTVVSVLAGVLFLKEDFSLWQALGAVSYTHLVGAFLTNLSPKNKWLAGAVLVGIGALAGIIGLILRGGDADVATTIWIAAIIIVGVAEAATAGLTSIWFVLGGVAGLIAAVCGGPVWLQVGLFFAVSIAALAFIIYSVKFYLHY